MKISMANIYLFVLFTFFAGSATATPIVNAEFQLVVNTDLPRLVKSLNFLPQGQHVVDVRDGFLKDNGALQSEVSVEHYFGIGLLDAANRGTTVDDGLTLLLAFSTPPRLVGIVLSNLYTVRSPGPLSSTIPQLQTAHVGAYNNNSEVVFDSIIKGSNSGYTVVDFRSLVTNINLLTISSGGGLPGLQSSNVGIAAFIVQVPEPVTWILMLMGILIIAVNRQTVTAIKK